jgi:hypothetical protein
MKSLLALALVFGLSACTKEQVKESGCKAQTSVLTVVSAQIGSTLSCKKLDVIMADMKAGLGKADLCKEEAAAQGVVGTIACPLVVDTLVGLAATKIPASWECDPKATADMLKEAAKAACEKAVKI